MLTNCKDLGPEIGIKASLRPYLQLAGTDMVVFPETFDFTISYNIKEKTMLLISA